MANASKKGASDVWRAGVLGPEKDLANTNTTTNIKIKTNNDKDLFCVGNVVTDGVQRIKG